MLKIGLFAYGEMGVSSFRALKKDFKIDWIVLPLPKNQTESEKQVDYQAKKEKIKLLYQPSSNNLESYIIENKPEIVVICSFDRILPKRIINLVPFINVHLGKLPEYRGRATVNWAIINGQNQTAVSIHRVVPELDSGNLLAQKLIKIEDFDDVNDVYKKINKYIEDSISNIVRKVLNGYKGIPQKGKPTYCCTRLPEDGLIDWNKSSIEIHNLIRALTSPYPGAFSYIDEKRVVILESELPKERKNYVGRIPGRIVSIEKGFGVEVLTGDSSLIIKKITVNSYEINAWDYIKSTKTTFGFNFSLFYEKTPKAKN